MAVLHAVLKGDPDARGKKGLADVVAKHDKWLAGRKFLLVPYHLPDSQSLDAAILGGYVAHVAKEHPGTAAPGRLPRRQPDRRRRAAPRAGGRREVHRPASGDRRGSAGVGRRRLGHAQASTRRFAEPPGRQGAPPPGR